MLKLIDAEDGQPIFINCRHIESLTPVEDGTIIRTATDRSYRVTMTPDQILATSEMVYEFKR